MEAQSRLDCIVDLWRCEYPAGGIDSHLRMRSSVEFYKVNDAMATVWAALCGMHLLHFTLQATNNPDSRAIRPSPFGAKVGLICIASDAVLS